MSDKSHQTLIEEALLSAIGSTSIKTVASLLDNYSDIIDMSGHNMNLAAYDVLRCDCIEIARLMLDAGLSFHHEHPEVAIEDTNLDIFKLAYPALEPFFAERILEASPRWQLSSCSI